MLRACRGYYDKLSFDQLDSLFGAKKAAFGQTVELAFRP